jgi:hypothetical protein
MSVKIKTLCLGLLAALSVSAFAVVNATANSEGHFTTTGNTHTHITGTESSEHRLHFLMHGLAGEIGCDESLFTATTTTETSIDLTTTAEPKKCYTTNSGQLPGSTTITMNGCTYTFRVAKGSTNSTEQTFHLICPPEKELEIHHPNCTIKLPPQTFTTGLTYTQVFEDGIHIITVDMNIQFAATEYEGGICVFTGTTHTGTFGGRLTLRAFNTSGTKVPLTFT